MVFDISFSSVSCLFHPASLACSSPAPCSWSAVHIKRTRHSTALSGVPSVRRSVYVCYPIYKESGRYCAPSRLCTWRPWSRRRPSGPLKHNHNMRGQQEESTRASHYVMSLPFVRALGVSKIPMLQLEVYTYIDARRVKQLLRALLGFSGCHPHPCTGGQRTTRRVCRVLS